MNDNPRDSLIPFLSPAKIELLAVLSEECGEAVQAVGKILRHGMESSNPNAAGLPPTNRETLAAEVGDVLAAVALLVAGGMIPSAWVVECAGDKLNRIRQFLHHQSSVLVATAHAILPRLTSQPSTSDVAWSAVRDAEWTVFRHVEGGFGEWRVAGRDGAVIARGPDPVAVVMAAWQVRGTKR